MRNPVARLKGLPRKRRGGETLSLQKPNGRVLCPALLLLIGQLLLGELVFSQAAVQDHLMGPKFQSRHDQFAVQWARLEKLEKQGQSIDCIFLGNSMVWIDVNPLVVSQTVEHETGQQIRCFNFGVSALPASSAGLIARVLVGRYHPKFLIYGTFARDYAIPLSAEDAVAISDTPWLEYQRGNFNLGGWLYDHSHLYQYQDYLADLLLLNLGDALPGYNGFPAYHDYGFDPKMNIRIDVGKSPNPGDINNRDPQKWLYHYEILQENLDGLRQIESQSQHGVEVIVVEMPFYPTALEFFMNGQEDYDRYVEQVAGITALNGCLFWDVKGQPLIPKEDWWDYFHMNIRGARVFSEWVGNELSAVLLRGSLVRVSSAK